jgi:hypothetical protein
LHSGGIFLYAHINNFARNGGSSSRGSGSTSERVVVAMAQKVQVVLVDDLDGGPADETVSFALDGTTYEIDLSAANAAALRNSVARFVAHARKAGRPALANRRGRRGNERPAQIRAWAREQGIEVNERGRVSAELAARYDAAHGGR